MTSGAQSGNLPGAPPEAPRVDPRIVAALARNDRYLFEFVEALALCPWARRCREMGRLARRVIGLEARGLGNDRAGEPESASGEGTPARVARLVEEAMVHVRELAAKPASEVEVGLLIFPALPPALRAGPEGARAFEQLCAEVREAMQREFARVELPFYCVAFHPGLPMDLADENRAVRFIRRSPDPTLQLVRVSVLVEARGKDEPSTRYVDASQLSHAELMAIQPALTLSEKIAQANFEALKREGPEKLRALLEGMARR